MSISQIPLYVCFRDLCSNKTCSQRELKIKIHIPLIGVQDFYVIVTSPKGSKKAKQSGGVQCKFEFSDGYKKRILYLSSEQIKQMTLSVEVFVNQEKKLTSPTSKPRLKGEIDDSKCYCLKITSSQKAYRAGILEVPAEKLKHRSSSTVNYSNFSVVNLDDGRLKNMLAIEIGAIVQKSYGILYETTMKFSEFLSLAKQEESIGKKFETLEFNGLMASLFIDSLHVDKLDPIKIEILNLLTQKLEDVTPLDDIKPLVLSFLFDNATQAKMFQALYTHVGEEGLKTYFFNRLKNGLEGAVNMTQEVETRLHTYADYQLKVALKMLKYQWDFALLVKKEPRFFSDLKVGLKDKMGLSFLH